MALWTMLLVATMFMFFLSIVPQAGRRSSVPVMISAADIAASVAAIFAAPFSYAVNKAISVEKSISASIEGIAPSVSRAASSETSAGYCSLARCGDGRYFVLERVG